MRVVQTLLLVAALGALGDIAYQLHRLVALTPRSRAIVAESFEDRVQRKMRIEQDIADDRAADAEALKRIAANAASRRASR